jgi:glycosyltransferase involved in cell wall biosynthesis/predicted nucleotidyltransferase
MKATIEDYQQVLDRFLETVERMGDDVCSVLLHGSMATGTVTPGWSDVLDAHVILRDEVLADREAYLRNLEVMVEACEELSDTKLPFQPFGYMGRGELPLLHVVPFYIFPYEPYSRVIHGEDILPEIEEGPASRVLQRTYFFEARHAVNFHLARYFQQGDLSDVERLHLVTLLLSVKKSLTMACVALGAGLRDIRKLDTAAQLRELVPGLDTSAIDAIDGVRERMRAVPRDERITRKSRGELIDHSRLTTAELLDVGRRVMHFLEDLHGEIVRRWQTEPVKKAPRAKAGPKAKRGRKHRPAVSPLHAMVLSLEYTPKLSGGMGTQVFELSRGLAGAGHEVTVLAYAPGEPRVLERPHETVHLISPDAGASGRARPSIVEGILDFNRALVERATALIAEAPHRPDVLHYHNWATYPAAKELGKRFGIPAIGTIHFVSEPIERWWGQTPDPEIVAQERRMFAEARALVAVSKSLRSVVRSTYDLDGKPFSVVHNGLDPAPFTSLAARPEERARLRATLAAEDEKVILFAGRLNLQKGVSSLLASATRVLEEYPRARYLVVGEPDSRGFGATVDGLLSESPLLRDRVTLLGKVPRHQLAALYQVVDLAVVPSIYEPFGYAAIEAMAAGLPIVATDVGGLAEIVEDGETGLLVRVERRPAKVHRVDVEELAAAQLALLSDEARAKALGEAARRRVVSAFSVERMVESTARAYLGAISQGNRSAAAPRHRVRPSGEQEVTNQGR